MKLQTLMKKYHRACEKLDRAEKSRRRAMLSWKVLIPGRLAEKEKAVKRAQLEVFVYLAKLADVTKACRTRKPSLEKKATEKKEKCDTAQDVAGYTELEIAEANLIIACAQVEATKDSVDESAWFQEPQADRCQQTLENALRMLGAAVRKNPALRTCKVVGFIRAAHGLFVDSWADEEQNVGDIGYRLELDLWKVADRLEKAKDALETLIRQVGGE